MEALLPHKTLELTDDFREVVDGKYAIDLATRQAVLQFYEPKSKCVQFEDIKSLKGQELRDVFTAQSVVYVYHDQIDNTGEHEEDAVFEACEKAVDEIAKLIQKISTSGNTYRFIVTADHGFIYKRDKVTASDKIGGMSDSNRFVKRRYIVSKEPITEQGVCNISLGYMLGSDVVKKADDKLYFISDNNEKISNENIYIADKRDEDVQKRLFRMRFTFKNKKYDKNRKYYLVAYDESNDVEVFRHEVIMDLAFSDNFGFDL